MSRAKRCVSHACLHMQHKCFICLRNMFIGEPLFFKYTSIILILFQCMGIFFWLSDFIPSSTCAGRSRLGVCRMKTQEAHLLALDITLEIKNPFPDLDISRHQKMFYSVWSHRLPVCGIVPLWLKLDVLVIGMKKSLSVDIHGRIPPFSPSQRGEVNLYFSSLFLSP